MQVARDVSTRLVAEGGDAETPESEILIDGHPTGVRVSGAVLEMAVRAGGQLILFMSDDVPFEDMLGIHLFDKNPKVLDAALLGGPYSTGSFSLLGFDEPNWVHFRFIGNTDWALEILDEPRLRIPLMRDAPGVKRKFGFTRRFIVHGRPLPERS